MEACTDSSFSSALGWGGIVCSKLSGLKQVWRNVLTNTFQIGSYISMGVSKLPADIHPERWELILFVVRVRNCGQRALKGSLADSSF